MSTFRGVAVALAAGMAALGGAGLVVTAAAAATATPAPAPGRSFMVVQPAGPKDLKTVGPYINSFLGYIEGRAGVPAASFKAFYFADLAKGEKALLEKKPGFAMPTVGLYLKHRAALAMHALVRIEVEGKLDSGYHLVGRAPAAAVTSLAPLAGKRVAWTAFDDPAFVSKVILAGTPLETFTLQTVLQPVAAARAVIDGTADLALLATADLGAARKLPGGDKLVVVWNAPIVPNPPVVSLAAASTADVAAVRDALVGMCGDTAKGGKGICDEFHISGFVAATDAMYDAVAAKLVKP
jgi:ABC-type phosphate/phosphonate transport system substrate-binding protein